MESERLPSDPFETWLERFWRAFAFEELFGEEFDDEFEPHCWEVLMHRAYRERHGAEGFELGEAGA